MIILNELYGTDFLTKLYILKYSIHSYFSFWVLFLQLLYYLGYLKQYQYSILILTLIVSICGFFINYINPKKIIIPIINIQLSEKHKIYFDIVCHHLPLLLFVLIYDKNIKRDNLKFCFLVIFIYILFNNPIKIYHIK
jgi:hypothetical protein